MATEEMQKRFHAAMAQRAEWLENAAPGRAKYDALAKQIHALLSEQKKIFAEEIQPFELKASACSNEAAALSRALQGKTGEPPQ